MQKTDISSLPRIVLLNFLSLDLILYVVGRKMPSM